MPNLYQIIIRCCKAIYSAKNIAIKHNGNCSITHTHLVNLSKNQPIVITTERPSITAEQDIQNTKIIWFL